MINAERLEEIFIDSLFAEDEPHDDHVIAKGITINVGFHPQRLESHRNEVVAMLDELPEKFHEKTGGGWSFLNACTDKDGKQWTGFHERVEQLFLLGIALGKVREVMPREMWPMLPGGVPYYVVLA